MYRTHMYTKHPVQSNKLCQIILNAELHNYERKYKFKLYVVPSQINQS